MRAQWDEQTVSGTELLQLIREREPIYASGELDEIDALKSEWEQASDKW